MMVMMMAKLMCCACWPRRVCVASHVLCSVLYIGAGAVQIVAGIFFLISLPVFKVGSNLWTGVWNVVVGVGGAVFSSVGDLTPSKHRILLYLTISVLVLNVINLVVLEVGEWRILMPKSAKAIIEQHSLQTLVLYARMTTSISTALAVAISFVDSQFMFCWLEHSLRPRSSLDHKETVSDIEYIIPRAKSGSMGKNNPHNLYSQYAAQSWVFDTDTVGSSQSAESPYGKLQQFDGSKTVVLKRKSNGRARSHPQPDESCNDIAATANAPATSVNAKPVVLVEDTTAGDNERHLQFMTSFSRTPSPVGPNSDSSSPCSNPPPIYECLERLTEPSVYRSRLNTALVMSNADRPSPSVSPRPHSVIVTDQVQYASLMVELEKTIGAKFPPSKTPGDSQSQTRHSSRRASSRDESHHKSSTSDTEFSKELEAALQLIQDLESPNTVETPSDNPHLHLHHQLMMRTGETFRNDEADRPRGTANNRRDDDSTSSSGGENNNFSDDSKDATPHRTYTGKERNVLENSGNENNLVAKRTQNTAALTSKPNHKTIINITPDICNNVHKALNDSLEDAEKDRHITSTYFSNENKPVFVNGVVNGFVSPNMPHRHIPGSKFVDYYDSIDVGPEVSSIQNHHRNNNADDADDDYGGSYFLAGCNNGHLKSFEIKNIGDIVESGRLDESKLNNRLEDSSRVFPDVIEEEEDEERSERRKENGAESKPNGVVSVSNSNSLRRSLSSVAKWRPFIKKKPAGLVLTPELESTILKSESLLHLTDVELVARYDRNKSVHRKIEEKVWQRINGASNSDSSC